MKLTDKIIGFSFWIAILTFLALFIGMVASVRDLNQRERDLSARVIALEKSDVKRLKHEGQPQ